MNVSREVKKEEAINRMRAMRLYPPMIDEFRRFDRIECSEPPFGACYYLDDDQQKIVKEFEEKHDALVYHVVRSYMVYGKMDSLLYVSDYPDEWPLDNDDLTHGIAMTYTHNYDDPICSEMGSIGIKTTAAAGLARSY